MADKLRKGLTGAVVAAALVLSTASPSAAQVYPPAGVVVSVDKTSYNPSGAVAVTVSGCAAGDAVTLTFAGGTLQGTAGASGSVTFFVVAPAASGNYTASASCTSTSVLGSSIVKVASATGANTLPKAGGPVDLPLVPGTAFLVVGAGMVLVARRRRQLRSV